MRTERTHEENQERAYIAASRRSDRSVEARVESARRASEIHKRRTGKALKVTEKDVLAEEMYEEEEDELPAQYKNLNAHLQTGSSDFDARLQAYLANAVAFRKALSGVSKPNDKTKQADFVNKRQLADHTSLFPKHSDAWKNIVIPKCPDTSSSSASASAFLPQGSNYDMSKYAPYDAKSSGLSNRRMSASIKAEPMNSMGTLRASDLAEHPKVYRPSPQHPIRSKAYSGNHKMTPPRQQPNVEANGINYDALDLQGLENSDSSLHSPFSSRLPANALDMLRPWQMGTPVQQIAPFKTGFESELFRDNGLEQRMENSIDATLVAPQDNSTQPKNAINTDDPNWLYPTWEESQQAVNDSASRKILEHDMWGSYIEDNPLPTWDWDKELAV